MNSFRQTKFAQLMTKGFKAHGKVHANKTYHHVLGTWLTNERETRKERKVIKILYPSQIYALDPSDETSEYSVWLEQSYCDPDYFGLHSVFIPVFRQHSGGDPLRASRLRGRVAVVQKGPQVVSASSILRSRQGPRRDARR